MNQIKKTVEKFHLRKDIVILPMKSQLTTLIYTVPEGCMLEVEKYQVIGPAADIEISGIGTVTFDYRFYDGETLIDNYINPRPYSSEKLVNQKLYFFQAARIQFPHYIDLRLGGFIITVIFVGKLYEIGYEAKPTVAEEYLDRIEIGNLHPNNKISLKTPADTKIL